MFYLIKPTIFYLIWVCQPLYSNERKMEKTYQLNRNAQHLYKTGMETTLWKQTLLSMFKMLDDTNEWFRETWDILFEI